eukprot:gnl/Chilomastix_cuspidata/3269.p1 GENE.gnl/Chilomastix_cuspidata/3269~~gnl/Chilomastix_cuspidata/3269.p1  ORF type:complete len:358 (+),score=150.90 gnl/Chilomastix_cuspidata/3269:3-1076(+)
MRMLVVQSGQLRGMQVQCYTDGVFKSLSFLGRCLAIEPPAYAYYFLQQFVSFLDPFTLISGFFIFFLFLPVFLTSSEPRFIAQQKVLNMFIMDIVLHLTLIVAVSIGLGLTGAASACYCTDFDRSGVVRPWPLQKFDFNFILDPTLSVASFLGALVAAHFHVPLGVALIVFACAASIGTGASTLLTLVGALVLGFGAFAIEALAPLWTRLIFPVICAMIAAAGAVADYPQKDETLTRTVSVVLFHFLAWALLLGAVPVWLVVGARHKTLKNLSDFLTDPRLEGSSASIDAELPLSGDDQALVAPPRTGFMPVTSFNKLDFARVNTTRPKRFKVVAVASFAVVAVLNALAEMLIARVE